MLSWCSGFLQPNTKKMKTHTELFFDPRLASKGASDGCHSANADLRYASALVKGSRFCGVGRGKVLSALMHLVL